jgi:hypothetical protein
MEVVSTKGISSNRDIYTLIIIELRATVVTLYILIMQNTLTNIFLYNLRRNTAKMDKIVRMYFWDMGI